MRTYNMCLYGRNIIIFIILLRFTPDEKIKHQTVFFSLFPQWRLHGLYCTREVHVVRRVRDSDIITYYNIISYNERYLARARCLSFSRSRRCRGGNEWRLLLAVTAAIHDRWPPTTTPPPLIIRWWWWLLLLSWRRWSRWRRRLMIIILCAPVTTNIIMCASVRM